MARKLETGSDADENGALAVDPARLAEIAHELRTPLGGITAMVAVLAQGTLSAEQRRVLSALQASVDHLHAVASDILRDHRAAAASAARASKGGPQPAERPRAADAEASDAAPLVLETFLEPIEFAAQARAITQAVRFTLRVAEGVPRAIVVDATRLRQMIDNLLDNAFKLTRAGDVALVVDRIGRRGGRHLLRFAVRDSGPGFTPAEADGLFEPFRRLDEGLPGTGIGLSIVRRNALAMGGRVGAEAEQGRGAIVWFTISVPSAPVPQKAFAKPALVTGNSPAAGRAEAPLVLVVDDNAASRTVISVVLAQFGCRVELAESAVAALEAITTRRFGAVLMDMTLGATDGVEATRMIRALEGAAGTVPIIALTGRTSKADERAFLQAGANAFLAKPLSPRLLLDALQETGVLPPPAHC